jgi:CheY-like chemotaxis protein
MIATAPQILIADDHPVLRTLVSRVLQAAGYRVVEADGGAAALALANAGAFDVILLDVEMADRDGYATAAAIRAGGGLNAQAPILFVTGHDPQVVMEDPRADGLIDGVIGKPVDVTTLVRAVAGAQRMRA